MHTRISSRWAGSVVRKGSSRSCRNRSIKEKGTGHSKFDITSTLKAGCWHASPDEVHHTRNHVLCPGYNRCSGGSIPIWFRAVVFINFRNARWIGHVGPVIPVKARRILEKFLIDLHFENALFFLVVEADPRDRE